MFFDMNIQEVTLLVFSRPEVLDNFLFERRRFQTLRFILFEIFQERELKIRKRDPTLRNCKGVFLNNLHKSERKLLYFLKKFAVKTV